MNSYSDDYYYNNNSTKRPKFTKEDAIYGIFNDSGGDYDRPTGGTDFYQPVSFVSKGTLEVGKNKMKVGDTIISSNTNDDKDEEKVVSSGNVVYPTKRNKIFETKPQPQTGGTIPQPSFERHTKGIGSKLLAKMGYSGGGLGRNGKGDANAIEVKLRPKNRGLSYNFEEKTHQQTLQTQSLEDNLLEQQELTLGKEKINELKIIHRLPRGKQRWRKAEILKESEPEKIPIIDMTGPQVKVIHDLSSSLHKPEPIYLGPLPEFSHNIRLLVDLSKAKSVNLDNLKSKHENTHRALTKQVNVLSSFLEEKRAFATHCRQFSTTLQNIVDTNYDVHDAHTLLSELFALYQIDEALFVEIKALKLIPLKLLPQAKAHPTAEIFKLLKQYLFSKFSSKKLSTSKVALYYVFISEGLLSSWRSSPFFRDLKIHFPQVTALLDEYMPLINLTPYTTYIRENVFQQLIFPRLLQQIREWDPIEDPVPFHTWLLPFVTRLPQDFHEQLWIPIRHKIAAILQHHWSPVDDSALNLLLPLKNSFPLMKLFSTQILPKLSLLLSNHIVISPTYPPPKDQMLYINRIMAWYQIIDGNELDDRTVMENLFAGIFEQYCFPNIFSVLKKWLLSGTANYQEVSSWYLFWKKQFPDPLIRHNHKIMRLFQHALQIINTSLQGLPLPSYTPHQKNNVEVPPIIDQDESVEDYSLLQLIEFKARELQILFLPTNRFFDGNKICRFGHLSFYIGDNNRSLFVNNKNLWTPTSVENLINLNKEKEKEEEEKETNNTLD